MGIVGGKVACLAAERVGIIAPEGANIRGAATSADALCVITVPTGTDMILASAKEDVALEDAGIAPAKEGVPADGVVPSGGVGALAEAFVPALAFAAAEDESLCPTGPAKEGLGAVEVLCSEGEGSIVIESLEGFEIDGEAAAAAIVPLKEGELTGGGESCETLLIAT